MAETKELIPKRRFKEFKNAEAWEQYKLGEISDVTKLAGFEFTEHIVYSDTGSIIALRGLNIKNGELVLDEVKYIDKSNFNKLNRSKLYKDDIMLTYVGTVGEVAKIPENDRFYLAPNVARIRLNKDFMPDYISQYMRSENFYNDIILPLIATSSQPALSMENVRKFNITFPRILEEQKQIGIFLDKLDNLITLHQRKLKKIKSMKKAYLYEMFPSEGENRPKRRFKGFTEDWEQSKLTDVVELFSGLTYSPNNVVKENGTFVLRSSNVQQGEIVNADNVYVRSEVVNSDNVQLGDVIVVVRNGSRNLIGKHAQIKEHRDNTVIGAFMTGLRSEQSSFINALLDTDLFKMEIDKNLGATINQITNGMFQQMNFRIPIPEEQEKIGDYFEKIDNLITLHQHKLEKFNNIKKAYLKEMFV